MGMLVNLRFTACLFGKAEWHDHFSLKNDMLDCFTIKHHEGFSCLFAKQINMPFGFAEITPRTVASRRNAGKRFTFAACIFPKEK
jgi:hypothetical protein